MNDYAERTRLIVANLPGDDMPMIVAAMPMSTWEVVPEDEYDAWKRTRLTEALADWSTYDVIEVVMSYPQSKLVEMFNAPEVEPSAMELDS